MGVIMNKDDDTAIPIIDKTGEADDDEDDENDDDADEMDDVVEGGEKSMNIADSK